MKPLSLKSGHHCTCTSKEQWEKNPFNIAGRWARTHNFCLFTNYVFTCVCAFCLVVSHHAWTVMCLVDSLCLLFGCSFCAERLAEKCSGITNITSLTVRHTPSLCSISTALPLVCWNCCCCCCLWALKSAESFFSFLLSCQMEPQFWLSRY